MEIKNKTAIQNEQQSTEEIINEIIKIFARNYITVQVAEKILYETKEKIKKQMITYFE